MRTLLLIIGLCHTILFNLQGETSVLYPIEKHLKKIEGKLENATGIKKIDCVYLINLDQRQEKLRRCIDQLENYRIHAHRFPAIYGWALPQEVFQDLGLKYLANMTPINYGWPEHSDVSFLPGSGKLERLDDSSVGKRCFHPVLSPGGVGCTLSHLSILKDAYDSSYEIIWILEDDFKIEGDPHQLTDYIKALDRCVGRNGWDVLYTDKKCGLDCFESTHDCWRPDMPFFNQYSLSKVINQARNTWFSKIGGRARTHSMLITRTGMKKILDFMSIHGIFNPYDTDIPFVPNINLFSLNQDLITWSYDGSDTVFKNF